MNGIKKLVTLLVLLFVGLTYVLAQNSSIDIVYLKNGSIIYGTVTRIIPDSIINIKTNDGSLFVYPFSEVLKIESEAPPPKTLNQKADNKNPYRLHKRVSLIGLAGSYTATVIGALAVGDETIGTTVIPVVGPWVSLVIIENDPEYYYLPGGQGLLIAAGIVQDCFLIYYLTALIKDHSYKRKLAVYPSTKMLGVTLTYRF